MKIEQLKSLDEDELAILWYCVNKIEPVVLAGIELEPEVFTSINHKSLMNRLTNCRINIKEEHHQVFDGLVAKLRV